MRRGIARLPLWRRPLDNDQGFTLIEILIASIILVIVLLGIYVIYESNQSTYVRGEGRANLQQNVRVALDQITRELLMAGYDPTHILANTGSYSGVTLASCAMQSLGASSLRFVADVNGDGTTEVVEFSHDATNKCIDRQVWTLSGTVFSTAGAQAITERNTMNSLTFIYRDQSNAVTAVACDVKRIDVSLSGTVKAGSQGAQSYSLNSSIRPRNL